MMENDNFRELLRDDDGFGALDKAESLGVLDKAEGLGTLDKDNGLGALVRAAVELPAPSADLERRVMVSIARRAVERSRLRARRGVIASLSGLAMLFAGCIVAVVVWFPASMPDFSRASWLDRLREIPLPEFLKDSFAASATDSVPLVEQWGGLALMVLLIAGAVGFVWYLNSLFSSDPVRD